MANTLKDSYRKIFLRTGLDILDNLSSRKEAYVDSDAKEISCENLIGNPFNQFLKDNFDPEQDLLLEKDDVRLRMILKIKEN
jgi:hypothetical protein